MVGTPRHSFLPSGCPSLRGVTGRPKYENNDKLYCYFRQCKSRNSLGTNAFSSVASCLSLSDQRTEDGASERAHGAFEEEATSIMFRFPGPTAFSASSPRRGEERRGEGHTHSHRQRQLEKGGREGGRKEAREGGQHSCAPL